MAVLYGQDKVEIVSVFGSLVSCSAAVNFNGVFNKGKPVSCPGLAYYITAPEFLFKQLVPLFRGYMITCTEYIEFDPVLFRSEKILYYFMPV